MTFGTQMYSAFAPPPSSRRILVLETRPRAVDALRLHLGIEGHDCEVVADLRSLIGRAMSDAFDLIVVTLESSHHADVDVCQQLRAHWATRNTLILMLAARGTNVDAVVALERGADDYLAEPFGMREFIARIHALLRRSQRRTSGAMPGPARVGTPVVTGNIHIDPARHRVIANGEEVRLTKQEFQLLYLLATNVGIVFNRDTLLSHIWSGQTNVTARSVNVLVGRVRRQLKRSANSERCIKTVRGVGYKFLPSGSEP